MSTQHALAAASQHANPAHHDPMKKTHPSRNGGRTVSTWRLGVHGEASALAFIGLVVVLGGWELASRTELLPRGAIPPITEIFRALVTDLQTATLWTNLGETVSAWLVGLAVVIVVAVPAGILIGSSRHAFNSTYLTLQFFRSIPSIAALPVLILITGVGFSLTFVMVVLTALWPLLIQAVNGAHEVDPIARATARVYGVKPVGVFFRVSLPSALPYIATGLRLSATIGLIIAIASSLVAGGDGLGAMIAAASRNSQYPEMYARILIAGLLGLAVTWAFSQLESRVLRWQPSRQSGQG